MEMHGRSYLVVFFVFFIQTQSFVKHFSFLPVKVASKNVRNGVSPIEEFFQYKSDNDGNSNILQKAKIFGDMVVQNSKIPHAKDEGWRTLSIRRLFDPLPTKSKEETVMDGYEIAESSLKTFIQSYVDENNPHSVITFLDGQYSPSLSSHTNIPRSIWTTLHDSSSTLLSEHEEDIWELLQDVPQRESSPRDSYGSDRLMGFNLMHMKDLMYINVPNHTHLTQPIQLIFCQTNLTTSAISFPRVLISIGENATLEVLQSEISYTNHTKPVVTLIDNKRPKKEPVYRLRSDHMLGNLDDSDDKLARGMKMIDFVTKRELSDQTEDGELVDTEISHTVKTTEKTKENKEEEDKGEEEGQRKEKQRYFVGSGTVVHMKGNQSHCRHYYMQDLAMDTRGYEVFSAKVIGSSVYDAYFLQCGASMHRLNVHIELMNTLSNTTANGIMLSEVKQVQDIHTKIVHNNTLTHTNQQERVVVGDYGAGVFKGMIHMPAIAMKADAAQFCRAIISGEKSRVLAIPSLNITADDVKCAHGVAVADLNENELFYLTARGITRKVARSLLSEAFALEAFPEDIPRDHVMVRRVISKLRRLVPMQDKTDLRSIQGIDSM